MTGSDSRRFYITTPIYYVNDKPHIGHAYTTLACDVLARFKRLDGYEVMFLTGTDEHGQKVEKAAHDNGVTPQAFTDGVSQNFRDLTTRMNYSNDDFIRTTEARHRVACQALWSILMQRGHITLGSYAGWYAVRDEAFYTESEIVDGKAPTGAPVEWVEEPSYFFNLSEWQQPLLDFYEANPEFVGPASRFNEVKSFVRGGLRDLSVSRASFAWGVPVPHDDAHVMYVWLDALTNYLTATGWPTDGEFGDAGRNAKFWPADLHM
ncbi:MAG: methionine--tRNA ligase, partial [Pseudomonadota bacterium]|nr:methionine--tRNA ligase [Pseudomonadota bacterium]